MWHMTIKGNVVKCKNPSKCRLEHYQGTYERAIKFFGAEDPVSWGKLINIIVYHQTSQMCVPKLSNELFDILVDAQSEHKYWAPVKEREKRALKTIEQAKQAGFIIDDLILNTLRKSEKMSSKSRIWTYEKWMKSG